MFDKKRNLRRFATSIDSFKEDKGASLWRRCAAVGDDHGDGNDGVSCIGGIAHRLAIATMTDERSRQ